MYLDRCLRDHPLLQAICRTNRPYGQENIHGLIVDYLGIFDDVFQAIQFDEEDITKVVSNIAELKGKLPEAIQKCLEYSPGVDRSVSGYEGLTAAQQRQPMTQNNGNGGGIKRMLNDSYREAKERLGIVTALPASSTSRKKIVGRIGASVSLDNIASRQLSASSYFDLTIDHNLPALNHQFCLSTCTCNSS